ncbi:hypothetical protein B0T16DRAFT_395866 [Cercophora newfieldiana]|uniref:Uncharacterized protein n=1 Tax=Cercophora newfieldiana TaxID=92897 RepID=A0AA39YLZ4_9PEZI|nr:hypothetical protein B0T16DRAFT_395866 [Cercophora newfieldiana]
MMLALRVNQPLLAVAFLLRPPLLQVPAAVLFHLQTALSRHLFAGELLLFSLALASRIGFLGVLGLSWQCLALLTHHGPLAFSLLELHQGLLISLFGDGPFGIALQTLAVAVLVSQVLDFVLPLNFNAFGFFCRLPQHEAGVDHVFSVGFFLIWRIIVSRKIVGRGQ